MWRFQFFPNVREKEGNYHDLKDVLRNLQDICYEQTFHQLKHMIAVICNWSSDYIILVKLAGVTYLVDH